MQGRAVKIKMLRLGAADVAPPPSLAAAAAVQRQRCMKCKG